MTQQATVPSVNPETDKDIPDSEGSQEVWIDPIFTEDALSDEPEPAEEAPAEGGKNDDLTAEEIKALLEQQAGGDDDDESEEDADGQDDADGNAGEAADGQEDDNKAKDGAETGKKPRRRSRARRERRERERLEREVTELKDRLARMEGGGGNAAPTAEQAQQEAEQAEADDIGPRPKLEDFDYDNEAWADAYAEWTDKRTEKRIRDAVEVPKKAEEEKAAEEARRETLDTFHERQEAARDRYDDYDDMVYDPTIFIPQAAADLIVESENGPDLAYYLATHQDEAMALKDATDAQVARALGRIEARLEADNTAPPPSGENDEEAGAGANDSESVATQPESAEQAKAAAGNEQAEPSEPPRKRQNPTQAPDPVSTVSGGASHGRDPSKMSYDEYVEARRKGTLR